MAFTRYCFTSRLYCIIIFFANTPFIVQYIVQYYQLLQPPAQFLSVFEVFGGVFWFLRVGFWMGRGDRKTNRSRHGKGGIIAHYCAISPSQTPFIAYNIAQYIFPTTPPFIAIKYWQYLVKANMYSIPRCCRCYIYTTEHPRVYAYDHERCRGPTIMAPSRVPAPRGPVLVGA